MNTDLRVIFKTRLLTQLPAIMSRLRQGFDKHLVEIKHLNTSPAPFPAYGIITAMRITFVKKVEGSKREAEGWSVPVAITIKLPMSALIEDTEEHVITSKLASVEDRLEKYILKTVGGVK